MVNGMKIDFNEKQYVNFNFVFLSSPLSSYFRMSFYFQINFILKIFLFRFRILKSLNLNLAEKI